MLSLCEILELDLDEMCECNGGINSDAMLTLLSNHLGHLPKQSDIDANRLLKLASSPTDLVTYNRDRDLVIVDRGLEYRDVIGDNPTIIDIVNFCQDRNIPLDATLHTSLVDNADDVVMSIIDYMSHGYSVDDLEDYYDI